VKIFASYGKFFDIMKMNLARGSFGSDYWHQCVYTLDFTDYTTITPTLATGAGCPASGQAPGVTVGRFIENVDFRATKADPRDPAIDTHMKPMSQHEFVTGVDGPLLPTGASRRDIRASAWITPLRTCPLRTTWAFTSATQARPLPTFYTAPLSSPTPAAQLLEHHAVLRGMPRRSPAIRRYDGAEFRLTHRGGTKWYGSVSYTYSKLTGNYPGLTNTDPTDGNGGPPQSQQYASVRPAKYDLFAER